MAIIAIFDSGVGGLSVHEALLKRLPEHRYLFISDNQAHPYGTKSDEFLISRVSSVVQSILAKHQPDLLVIACNTASTVVLPSLREKHSTPIVGVVPAIKPAALTSKTQRIAVLGTPATIARPYTQALIDEFAAHCTVLKVGSSLLVELAEQKLRGQAPDQKFIKQELAPIKEFNGCDTVVLSCTHFPLLNKEISDELNFESCSNPMSLIDSGEAIARRVESLLVQRQIADSSKIDKLKSGAFMTKAIDPQGALIAALTARQLPYLGAL